MPTDAIGAPGSVEGPARATSRAPTADPYLKPSLPLANRFARALWSVAYHLLFRPSFRTMFRWRATLLRLFGARIGPGCRIYAGAQIWAPWNLVCEDVVFIADGVVIYNPAPVVLRSHAILSQQSYLCGATHDYDDASFPMIWAPIEIGRYAWVAARACVQMGVHVGEGAVLGLGSIATRDLEPWTVYAGAPARKIRGRHRTAD
jgi:putative colanic acid biosynthesis acetyltransferase WcaF